MNQHRINIGYSHIKLKDGGNHQKLKKFDQEIPTNDHIYLLDCNQEKINVVVIALDCKPEKSKKKSFIALVTSNSINQNMIM